MHFGIEMICFTFRNPLGLGMVGFYIKRKAKYA